MKHPLHMLRTGFLALFSFAILAILFTPVPVFAEVVPLAPLPTNFDQGADSLGGYINTIFYTVIAGAAILAVLRVVWGGFQYMTSEAVTQTKDARTIITMAIVGLILLLASWLILSVINPSLTRLDALEFDFSPLENVSGQVEFGLGGQTLSEGEIDEILSDENFNRTSSNPAFGNSQQNWTDVTNATNQDLTNLSSACSAKGDGYSSDVRYQRTCTATYDGERYGEQVQAGEEYTTDFGRDVGLEANCWPGDDLVKKDRYFICEKPI